jgi:hypothetical protein
VRKADLQITGEENLTHFRSSPSFDGCFCKICGSHLFDFEDSEPSLMYLNPGSLDDGAHPGHPTEKEYHIYVRSRCRETIGDDLPQYVSFADGSSPRPSGPALRLDTILRGRSRSSQNRLSTHDNRSVPGQFCCKLDYFIAI